MSCAELDEKLREGVEAESESNFRKASRRPHTSSRPLSPLPPPLPSSRPLSPLPPPLPSPPPARARKAAHRKLEQALVKALPAEFEVPDTLLEQVLQPSPWRPLLAAVVLSDTLARAGVKGPLRGHARRRAAARRGPRGKPTSRGEEA